MDSWKDLCRIGVFSRGDPLLAEIQAYRNIPEDLRKRRIIEHFCIKALPVYDYLHESCSTSESYRRNIVVLGEKTFGDPGAIAYAYNYRGIMHCYCRHRTQHLKAEPLADYNDINVDAYVCANWYVNKHLPKLQNVCRAYLAKKQDRLVKLIIYYKCGIQL